MSENDYITATNRVKVSLALSIMTEVLTGEQYGVDNNEISEITKRLAAAESKLFASLNIQAED